MRNNQSSIGNYLSKRHVSSNPPTGKGYVTYGRVITALTVFGVSLQVANFWHLGHGRTVYPLMLTIYTTFAVLELTLALRTKAQLSLILCVGIDLWAMAMAIYGMWRL